VFPSPYVKKQKHRQSAVTRMQNLIFASGRMGSVLDECITKSGRQGSFFVEYVSF
jgi:hypothetical protein